MNKTALLVASLLWLVATGLYLTSMLTNFWVSSSVPVIGTNNYGLFKTCSLLGCRDIGWDFSADANTLNILIPRVIMLGSAAFVVIGMLFGLPGYCAKNSCLVITEGIFLIVAGFIIFGACAAFTAMNILKVSLFNEIVVEITGTVFHYSFYFGWISGLLYLMSGVCTIVGGRSKF